MTLFTIGVDISKDHLDVHRLPDGQSRHFTNDKAGYLNASSPTKANCS